MCFSAEASFASAAGLLSISVYALRVAARRAPRRWPLAVAPGLFGVQQFSEGLVWLGLGHENAQLTRAASLVFLFFALGFWPSWFSLTGVILEPLPGRRKFLLAWAVLSTAWFWFAYLPILANPARLAVWQAHHSLHYAYADAAWLAPAVRWPLRGLYVVTAAFPLLATSARRGLGLPVALAVAAATAAVLLYDHAFTSVWCFFAAVASVSLALALAVPQQESRPDTSPEH